MLSLTEARFFMLVLAASALLRVGDHQGFVLAVRRRFITTLEVESALLST
jgi:hypothetical protein